MTTAHMTVPPVTPETGLGSHGGNSHVGGGHCRLLPHISTGISGAYSRVLVKSKRAEESYSPGWRVTSAASVAASASPSPSS